MSRFIILLFITLSFLVETDSAHAFGRRRNPSPAPTPTPAPVYQYSEEEVEGIRLINQHRLSMGLVEVIPNDFISAQCLNHSLYMIQQNRASHDYFTQRSNAIVARLKVTAVGENVAYNFVNPASVVRAWLNSSGHRENLEKASHRRVGYSVRSNSAGKKFYTMIFSN
jgi:uncharacterized protein YkwD